MHTPHRRHAHPTRAACTALTGGTHHKDGPADGIIGRRDGVAPEHDGHKGGEHEAGLVDPAHGWEGVQDDLRTGARVCCVPLIAREHM